MAEAQSTTRSVWLAAGITAVVVVVVAAIFGAPAVIDCTRDQDGFGACIRDRLVAARLLPAPPKPPAEPVTEQTPPTPTPEPAAPAIADLTVPQLGLVRAEPNGSLVIAGSAAPGTKVEIYANDLLIGTATVEASGDWVLVPDTPLPPGGYEIRVVEPAENKTAEQSVVVVIDEDKTSEPLVVASTPGEASKVLQGLSKPVEAPMASGSAETAAEPTEPASTEAQPAETEPMATAEAEAPAAQTPSQPVTPEPAATEPQPPQSEPEPAIIEPTPEESQPSTPAVEPEPATEPAAPEQTEVANAPQSEDVVGDVDKLQAQIEELAPVVAPTIDAIEIDGDKNFFAGAGQEGATVRLYVDNAFIGDTIVNEGRWLLETTGALKNKTQRVRADELAEGSADVIARAEVDFIFNVPEDETQEPEVQAPAETAVAEAPVELPAPDFAIDTEQPVAVETDEPDLAVADAEPAAPVALPAPDFAIDTEQPVGVETGEPDLVVADTEPTAPVADEPVADAPLAEEPAAPASAETTDRAQTPAQSESSPVASETTSTGAGQETGAATQPSDTSDAGAPSSGGETASGPIVPPEPDFSIDTGIAVTVVPEPVETATRETVLPENDEQAEARERPATPPQIEAGEIEPAPAPEPDADQSAVANNVAVPDPDFSIDTEAPAVVPLEQPEVPQLVAVPVGDPDLQRFASGKAIIRRGDNLWTIARRVYGSGYEYLQIYQANRGQIRNPNLIYPGQVFDLPDSQQGAGAAE